MNTVIILAAGNSTRMGNNISKQFLKLMGKEVISYTIETFEKNDLIDEIILVIKENDISRFELLIKKYNFKKIKLVIGGNNRQESACIGLKNISKNAKKILIHDGARPFIKKENINNIINLLNKEKAVVLAVKTKDTIKMIDNDYIKKTLNRSELINVQTPQGFTREVIFEAYKYANENNLTATDDSQLVEALGIKIKVLYGNYENIKITTIEDIKFGEIIIRKGK
jgi:2-C-methyl-D-erythritol 4-phosphate cytidylyltransferase